MQAGRDHLYDEIAATVPDDCPCEPMNAEDPLFILYTSGSTGKPKGVLHTTGGYAVWTATTFHYVFDYRAGELFWCTADVGWVTGHSYVVYGPLANGAATLMFEGVPNHPDFSRFWDVVERHKVAIFYTAPTAIRALMREGEGPGDRHDRSSIRLLGTVGEPINPEAWLWYCRVVGEERCAIVDTWWQTETGGIMITTLPGAHAMKPGSAGRPFFGIVPELIDPDGAVIEGATSGNLCIARSWPGQMRAVYGDHDRFVQTYFSAYRGKYFTGDGCRRDEDDYYWITGRVDDVLNISGHRLGTAEIESALVSHPLVAEAAVVGYPHDIKGQGIYCYVTLIAGEEGAAALEAELKRQVRTEISAIATPDLIHFTPSLPKTRSGKIMRRILRKIAENEFWQPRRHEHAGRAGAGRQPDRGAAEPVAAMLRPDRHHRRARMRRDHLGQGFGGPSRRGFHRHGRTLLGRHRSALPGETRGARAAAADRRRAGANGTMGDVRHAAGLGRERHERCPADRLPGGSDRHSHGAAPAARAGPVRRRPAAGRGDARHPRRFHLMGGAI